MLEKKIDGIGEYFVAMSRTKNGESVVSVELPINWKVWGKKDEAGESVIKVNVVGKNNNTNTFSFISQTINHSGIIDFITIVMNQNLELEGKKELYQKKIKELADIFDTTPLSKLENITFKVGKTPTKPNKTGGEKTNEE